MASQAERDYALQVAKQIVELFIDAERQILEAIAGRIARGLDQADWQMRQMQEITHLRREIRNLIRGLSSGSEVAIRKAIENAYSFGTARAASELAKAGGAFSTEIAFGGVNLDALQALVDTGKRTIGALLMPLQSTADKIYADVVSQTASRMLAGVGTRRQAAALALRDWARRGITGFIDNAGRSWDLVSYAEMAARTTASQAIIAGHTNRLVETGHDLAMVSDAPEECKWCRPWEGKIVSLTGATRVGRMTEYGVSFTVSGTLSEAKQEGLFHPNCRHRTVAFFPGVTKRLTDTADPEGNALRNQQRYRERKIRQYKRELAVAQKLDPKSPETIAMRAKLRSYQADFKAWREANDRKDLSYRTSLKVR